MCFINIIGLLSALYWPLKGRVICLVNSSSLSAASKHQNSQMPLKWGTVLWLSSGPSNQIWRPDDKEWFVFTVQWDTLPLIKGMRFHLCIVGLPCCAWLGFILKAALMHWCTISTISLLFLHHACFVQSGPYYSLNHTGFFKPSKPLRDPEDAERSYDGMMYSRITLAESF